jgi:hypothetical protein
MFFASQNGKSAALYVETFATRGSADAAFDLARAYSAKLFYNSNAILQVVKLYKESE